MRWIIALWSLLAAAPSLADNLYLISNSALKINAAEFREIYLGEKQFSGGSKLAPVDNSAAQAKMLATVLQMDADKYKTVWTKRAFRDGVNPPPVKGTDLEVVEFVKANPGGVGYVGSAPSGVTVVQKY